MISFPMQVAGLGREIVADPLFARTAVLLDGIGANGGTSFPDRSSYNRTFTANGNVQTDTALGFVNDSSSILFDGTGDFLTAPTAAEITAMSTSDFTIETYYRTTNAAIDQMIAVYAQATVATGAEVLFGLAHFGAALSGKVRGFTLNTTTQFNCDSLAALSANTDYHIAFSCVRTVSTNTTKLMYLHINGVNQSSNSTTLAFNTPASQQLRISKYENTTFRYINGRLGRWRLTVGRARYNDSNFTPPKLPFAKF